MQENMKEPRVVLADNAGLFTLEGTRTHLVGREQMVVVDPGPDLPSHRAALLARIVEGGARRVDLLLTHDHPDHSAGTAALARALTGAGIDVGVGGSETSGVVRTLSRSGATAVRLLEEGDEISTDEGRLRVIPTPGHTRDHLALEWVEAAAVFPGDLVLGVGRTAWVGSYPGCVEDYLASLARLDSLGLRRLYPAHGPPIEDPKERLDRFRRHRLKRVEEVREAVEADPDASVETMVARIYGDALPNGLHSGAVWSVHALLDHLGVRPFPEPGPETEG